MAIGRIAEYELIEPLGEGGMGVVYLARDTRLGRTVALKLLPHVAAIDPVQRERLLRSARATASLSHPAIATCFDVGEALLDPPDLLAPGAAGPLTPVPYLTMEYVPGQDLKALIGDHPLPIANVLAIGQQVACALEAAHAAGVVHRDLKPENVRVMPDQRVKVIDFGLARLTRTDPDDSTQSALSDSGSVLGTVAYMSPEQTRGSRVDARSDLFALGTLLYELVTGRNPFDAPTYSAIVYHVCSLDPPPLARYASGVPDELERIVRKLLEKDPERRFQSAREVRLDLDRLIGRGSPRRRVPRWLPASVGAALAIAMATLGFMAWHRHRPALAAHGIAVAPFANLTGDSQIDYLGHGLAGEIAGDLVRRSRLNIVNYASVRALGERARDPRAIAKELGVSAVLGGSVRRDRGETTVDVELVDGARGDVAWTARYPYRQVGATDLEDRIVEDVTRRLTGHEPPGESRPAPRTASAYDLYLRAVAILDDPDDPHAPDRAIERYDAALALDPSFALAWAGRSRAALKVWQRDKGAATLASAADAAARALQLAPDLLEAQMSMATVDRTYGRRARAIRELEAVCDGRPDWDEAEVQLSVAYRDSGDYAAAERHLRRALALRPDSWKNWNALGVLLTRRADYDGARDAFRNIVRLVPDKNRGYEQIGAIEQMLGNFGAAVAMYEQLPGPVQDGTLASNIGSAYFFTKRLPEARKWYQLAIDLEPATATLRMNMGDWYARAGRADSSRMQYAAAAELLQPVMRATNSPQRALNYALCLAKTGDCAGAAATLARIAAALPDSDADVAHTVARVEASCGHTQQARAALDRAVRFGLSPTLLAAEDEFRGMRAQRR